MRRTAIKCVTACVVLLIGLVIVRVATRNRVEQLAEMPGVGHSLSTGLGPFAHGERLLVWDRSGSQLQLVDQGLIAVDSIPAPADTTQLSVGRDLSTVVALDYRNFCLINTRTKASKSHALDQMSTEAFLSPDGTQLWVGEYDTGIMHQYSVRDVEAQRVRSVNIKDEALRVLGPPAFVGPISFRVVAIADSTTTYLYSDRFNAILIYDWIVGRSIGSIPLPYLHSSSTFCQSPDGALLAIVSNRLVLVDLKKNAVVIERELNDYARAGDFNAEGDRFFVAYSAPDMLALPLTHRGGQIDAFDLNGNHLKTWHSTANRIRVFGARGPVAWMVTDDGKLRTFRLP
jgi:hypothetical protein